MDIPSKHNSSGRVLSSDVHPASIRKHSTDIPHPRTANYRPTTHTNRSLSLSGDTCEHINNQTRSDQITHSSRVWRAYSDVTACVSNSSLAGGPTSTGVLYCVITRDSYSLPDPKAISRPFGLQLILPSLLGQVNLRTCPCKTRHLVSSDGDTLCPNCPNIFTAITLYYHRTLLLKFLLGLWLS